MSQLEKQESAIEMELRRKQQEVQITREEYAEVKAQLCGTEDQPQPHAKDPEESLRRALKAAEKEIEAATKRLALLTEGLKIEIEKRDSLLA